MKEIRTPLLIVALIITIACILLFSIKPDYSAQTEPDKQTNTIKNTNTRDTNTCEVPFDIQNREKVDVEIGQFDFDKLPPLGCEWSDKQQALIDTIKKRLPDIACNINSPVEMSYLLKAKQVPFQKNLLLRYDYNKYILDSEKALALGAYGVDMAYLNLHEVNSLMINYFDAIYRLSNDLGLSGFFSYDRLKNIALNCKTPEEKEKLLLDCTYDMNRIEETMLRSGNSHIGMLIILGAWIEGAHILSQSYTFVLKDKMIRERVAEQRVYISELYKLLKLYEEFPGFERIIKYIDALYKDFLEVDYRIVVAQKKTTIEGMDGDTTDIEIGEAVSYTTISDSLLNVITLKIQNMRKTFLLKNKQ